MPLGYCIVCRTTIEGYFLTVPKDPVKAEKLFEQLQPRLTKELWEKLQVGRKKNLICTLHAPGYSYNKKPMYLCIPNGIDPSTVFQQVTPMVRKSKSPSPTTSSLVKQELPSSANVSPESEQPNESDSPDSTKKSRKRKMNSAWWERKKHNEMLASEVETTAKEFQSESEPIMVYQVFYDSFGNQISADQGMALNIAKAAAEHGKFIVKQELEEPQEEQETSQQNKELECSNSPNTLFTPPSNSNDSKIKEEEEDEHKMIQRIFGGENSTESSDCPDDDDVDLNETPNDSEIKVEIIEDFEAERPLESPDEAVDVDLEELKNRAMFFEKKFIEAQSLIKERVSADANLVEMLESCSPSKMPPESKKTILRVIDRLKSRLADSEE